MGVCVKSKQSCSQLAKAVYQNAKVEWLKGTDCIEEERTKYCLYCSFVLLSNFPALRSSLFLLEQEMCSTVLFGLKPR